MAGPTAACDVQLGMCCAAMFNMLGRWPLAAWLACVPSGWAWTNLVHIWSISAGFCVLWSPLIQGTRFAVSDGTGHMKRRMPDATIEYTKLSPICAMYIVRSTC